MVNNYVKRRKLSLVKTSIFRRLIQLAHRSRFSPSDYNDTLLPFRLYLEGSMPSRTLWGVDCSCVHEPTLLTRLTLSRTVRASTHVLPTQPLPLHPPSQRLPEPHRLPALGCDGWGGEEGCDDDGSVGKRNDDDDSGGGGSDDDGSGDDVATAPGRGKVHTILTIPYHIPHHTIPYHAIPRHTMPYDTIPYHTMPCHAMPCHAMPCHSIPYHTVP